ncbi:nestin isoform X1 [Coregonus clupeaformis]|uniref:nestin isoform X1 n=1 Tax=Coregonus clupeaformis TaxID=59861 RepID=UPI001E1C6165|nr:nestin isoform X1 [Coregonus clupeaformis]
MELHNIRHHHSHRTDDKLQMLNLNQRLETYLGRVRLLEEENKLLCQEIQALRGSGQGGRMGLEDKLSLARQEVEEAWREKDRVELELGSLGEELQALGLQRQWEADAHGEVKKKLADSRKEMEEERRAQIWLREKVSQLEKQIQFQIQTHQEDVAGFQATLIHVRPALPPPPPQTGTQLPSLQELGEEYSQMAVRAWHEAAMVFQGQVNSLEESLNQARTRLAQVGQEKIESQLKLQALENELASAQDRRQYLERSVVQQRDRQRQEIQNLQAHLEVLEMEKGALGDQIDTLLIESRGLLQLKMSLGMEVATYRALLDNESLMGDFSSTNQLRSTYMSDGVPSSRGVKQSFKTQLATSHIISPISTIHGASPRSNVTMMSASPIWTQNRVTLNETPESCRKTEERQVDFGIGSNRQVSWSTPYAKVPQDGISVDHFRPQDVHEEVNYAEPLSPPTEEAGADVVSWLGSDHKEQSMWDMEKEEEDQNIVRTWVAEEKPVMESTMSHQVETSFSMPTVFSTHAQELYSPSVSYERAHSTGSVTGAHSGCSANNDNDVRFEMFSEKEEPLLDLNASEERDLETARKDAEWVGNEGLESETASVLEQAFETFTSSQAFEYGVGKSGYNKPIEFNQEDNMSYESAQASHGSDEAFHHVKRVEEDVINLTKEDDENDMSNKDEEQSEAELHPYGYGKDNWERLGGFNKEHDMTERIDEFNQEENISYESAQASHWSEEVFHHVERVEEGDIHFRKGDDENDMFNKREEQYALHPNGDVMDEWDRVEGYNEENGIRERTDDWKEGKDHMKAEEMRNNRETQPNRSDQEYIPSGGEKLNQSEQKHIPSGREKLNISDKEDDDEANYSQNTSVLWRAELEGNSYSQDNTLADTHPLIRYKSDETDTNTQASHMGESDSSDGEEDREVGQTATGTWGEGKSKQFDTMEDLYEESEGDVIDQESNMGSTHTEDMDASQTKEHATQENNEENAVDQLIQKAEEEQSYEELTEPGEYSIMCSDEDYNEEIIDRLVEQELENLSISSYNEHFTGQMIESESVLSLQIESHTELSQTQDMLYSEEVEQIHSERLNQTEQKHITSGGEKLNQSEPGYITSGGEKRNIYEQEHIPSDGEKLHLSESEYIPSGGEKLNQSEQENIPLGGEKLNQSEHEYITSGGEKLNLYEQEHIPSDGEKMNESEPENIPLGGEKMNQSEQEYITSGGEKLNIYEQEHIPSDREKMNQSEQEHIPSGGEKLNQSESEYIPSNREKMNQSEPENIPLGGEKLNQSESEYIPSNREKMNQSEPENIPLGGEKLNQSEHEYITSGGEKLNQSEKEHIPLGGEKLNQSEQEHIPLGGEKLNLYEQEHIPSDGEKMNQSEPECIPSGGEKLNKSEQEHIPSGGEKLNQSEQEYIPSGGEKLNQSEQQYIPSGGEKLNQSEPEYIPSGGEKLNQSEPEYIPSGGEKLNQSEPEYIPSGGEKLNKSEQENIPLRGEKLNQSESEYIPSNREKMNQSEPENIPLGGEKLNQSEHEYITSGGEKLNQSEKEHIPLGGEKLNQSEQEHIPLGGEKLNLYEQEHIPSDGEKMNQSEPECIPSGGEKLNKSEQEHIPSGGEKLNQSEQEYIPSGGEKLNQSEQQCIPSGGEKLNQSEPEYIPSGGEKLNQSEPEYIPSGGEKLNQSEPEYIPSGGEKLNQSEPEYIPSGGEKRNKSEQEHIPSNGEKLNQSEQENIPLRGEKLKQSEQENIPLGGEKLNQSEQEYIPSGGEKLNQSEQENIPLGGEKLNLYEQEHIPSDEEKMNQSEPECIPSKGEKMNQSEPEYIPLGREKLNQSEQQYIPSGGEKLNQYEQDHIPSGGEKLNQSEQEYIPSGGEKLNQSEQQYIPSGGEKLNQSKQEHIPSGGEKLNQSEQECISSEVMYSVHSTILMTSEHTSLRESSVEMSKAEYLAQGKVFSRGLGTEVVPDKIGEDDQKLSMLTHADFTESHSIHSSLNSRLESQTNMNNLDIEESNSIDDESPNASQYLQPVTKANLTADQKDLLDVAVSHYEDCNALIEHSLEEVTSNQASHECLQTDEWEVLESPNKHLESGDPFAGHKRDSERSSKTDSKGRDLHSFLSSGVHNNFWGSNLETGAPYQPDEPYDHVTELPNQNLDLADNLSWVDLENPQAANWNTKMDSDTPKASTLEEEDKQMPPQVKQLVCREVVEGVNVTSEGSEDEGDSWSSGEE